MQSSGGGGSDLSRAVSWQAAGCALLSAVSRTRFVSLMVSGATPKLTTPSFTGHSSTVRHTPLMAMLAPSYASISPFCIRTLRIHPDPRDPSHRSRSLSHDMLTTCDSRRARLMTKRQPQQLIERCAQQSRTHVTHLLNDAGEHHRWLLRGHDKLRLASAVSAVSAGTEATANWSASAALAAYPAARPVS